MPMKKDEPESGQAASSPPSPPPSPPPSNPFAAQAPPPAPETPAVDAKQQPPEEIPMKDRVQTGVPYQEGEEVYQHGTEPAPAPQQDKALATEPVELEFEDEGQPPPGKQVPTPP